MGMDNTNIRVGSLLTMKSGNVVEVIKLHGYRISLIDLRYNDGIVIRNRSLKNIQNKSCSQQEFFP